MALARCIRTGDSFLREFNGVLATNPQHSFQALKLCTVEAAAASFSSAGTELVCNLGF